MLHHELPKIARSSQFLFLANFGESFLSRFLFQYNCLFCFTSLYTSAASRCFTNHISKWFRFWCRVRCICFLRCWCPCFSAHPSSSSRRDCWCTSSSRVSSQQTGRRSPACQNSGVECHLVVLLSGRCICSPSLSLLYHQIKLNQLKMRSIDKIETADRRKYILQRCCSRRPRPIPHILVLAGCLGRGWHWSVHKL